MTLRSFENRLERLVEGFFARTFKAGLQPVELGRRAIREMRAGRTLDVRGQSVVPNHYLVRLAAEDYQRFEPVQEGLRRELQSAIRESAQEDRFGFLGRVVVDFETHEHIGLGTSEIVAAFDETVGAEIALAVLELPDGSEFPLTSSVAKLGRHPDSSIVLSDPNASRHHAEIQPDGDGFTLVDLGSTNGSRVNGEAVSRYQLADRDEISVGAINLIFRVA